MSDPEKTRAAFGIHRLNSGEYRELSYLMNAFNLSRQQASRLCTSLRIPLLFIGKGSFFNQYTLEKALYFLLRFGGPGFAAPGSDKKNKGHGNIPVEITDDFIEKCSSAEALVEIYLAGGKRDKAGDVLAEWLKKMKPTKEKNGQGNQNTTNLGDAK